MDYVTETPEWQALAWYTYLTARPNLFRRAGVNA